MMTALSSLPIPVVDKEQVERWKHERATEAIIHCLPNSELLKLENVQDDVTATP